MTGESEPRAPQAPMSSPSPELGSRAPRSAGVAGIAFSILFAASILIVTGGPPRGADEAAVLLWFQTDALPRVTISALYLAPFAGIAFLWFIGVIRDRVGIHEDRLFSTVFLGSGLLFIAMYWSAAANLASLVAGNRFDVAPPLNTETLETIRSAAFSFLYVLAARAAAVFMLVTSTIGWRTKAFPRLLSLIGYGIALLMMLSLSFLHLIVLLFPVWVFIASVYVLATEVRGRQAEGQTERQT